MEAHKEVEIECIEGALASSSWWVLLWPFSFRVVSGAGHFVACYQMQRCCIWRTKTIMFLSCAAFKHRRLRLLRENSPELQELESSSADEFSLADFPDTDDWSLIPGLPQELALRCLARVPRVLHGKLRAVCKPWRKVVESQEFLDLRKQLEVSEDWLYLHVGNAPRLDEVQVGCTGGRWQIVGGFSLWHALDPYRYICMQLFPCCL